MTKPSTQAICCAVLAVAGGLFAGPAGAGKPFPAGPVEFVVCYPPGGGGDIMARIVTPAAGAVLGVSLPIVYKAGGDATLGVSYALNKKPDGYTLFALHQSSTFVGQVFDALPYDMRDIYPLANWVDNLNIVAVQKESRFKTFKEVIEFAKQQPGRLKYATATTRSSQGIGMELLKANANVDIVPVPFKGTGPAMTALLGGHVDMSAIPYAVAKPHVQAGTIRPLVVFGGKRVKEMPGVPSVVDFGYEETPLAIGGVGISAKTPKDRIDKIHAAFEKAMKDPGVIAQLEKAGFEPAYMNHEEFRRHLAESLKKVEKIKDQLKD